MTDVLVQKINGNYSYQILKDGTKIRNSNLQGDQPELPESIDIKITDFCDAKCKYCHESSTVKGSHGSLDFIYGVLGQLDGLELAIGGGNPLSHPDLIEILTFAKQRNIICNITVNAKHIRPYRDFIQKLIDEELIKGIGISYVDGYEQDLTLIKSEHTIYHLIVGVHPISTLKKLPVGSKVLLLGYKDYGFGVKYKLYNNTSEIIRGWYRFIGDMFGRFHFCFDNLALEQLDIQSLVPEDYWAEHYMGDDGQYTMYLDCVKQTYARSSTSERILINEQTIQEIFRMVRNEK